jgi:hypothetical protein
LNRVDVIGGGLIEQRVLYRWPLAVLFQQIIESPDCQGAGARIELPSAGQRALEIANMADIAKFLFCATGSNVDDETVQTIIILCGMGLLLSLLFLTYGLDLCLEFI